MAALAVIAFYSVSGGPFGVEASVRAAGHFYTLLGFLIAPFVWSCQEAAMTAELGAAFPESAGGVAWVEAAFGPLWGWLAGYLGWVAGATDNAIYPVLFLDYLLQAVTPAADVGSVDDGSEVYSMHPLLRFILIAATTCTLAYCNWLGLAFVGRMSLVICFIAMSPFMLFSILGAFHCNPARWLERPQLNATLLALEGNYGKSVIPEITLGGVLWRPFLNNLFWNLNSFDAVGSLAADVEDPGRVFPLAMFWSWLLVTLSYLIPLLVAMGASTAPQSAWVDGYFTRVAHDVVGPWLADWLVFAAGISNIAMFQAELSADAYQLAGMAERRFIPEIFATRSPQGTPTYGILVGTLVIVIMGVSQLDQLIELLNFNYSIALLLEYFAFIQLRIAQPDLPRPWRVPLSTTGCIIAVIPTILMIVAIIVMADYTTWVFAMLSNLVGLLLYRIKIQHESQPVKEARSYSLVHPVRAASSTGTALMDTCLDLDEDTDEGFWELQAMEHSTSTPRHRYSTTPHLSLELQEIS